MTEEFVKIEFESEDGEPITTTEVSRENFEWIEVKAEEAGMDTEAFLIQKISEEFERQHKASE